MDERSGIGFEWIGVMEGDRRKDGLKKRVDEVK